VPWVKVSPLLTKIPLSPPFPKGDNYTSLWKREAGRDLKKLFSEQYVFSIMDSLLIPPYSPL
jgi:hypothetical protein